MERIEITYEQFSDDDSPPIAKVDGKKLTPVMQRVVEKLNEIIDLRNGDVF